MSPSELRSAWSSLPAMLLCVMLAGTVLAGMAPAVASAQQSDDERARAHFLAGRSYMEQARYDDAAEQFQEAYRLSQRPEMLLNASMAYERGLRFDEAIATLERYMEVRDDASERATLEERLARLRELRARAAALSATTSQSPEQRAEEGPRATTAPVDEGETATEPPADASSAGGELGDLGVVGLVLGGTGAAALVVSLATGLVAHDKYQSLESRCGPDGRACPPGSQSDIDSGNALAITSTVTTVGGLALVAAGAALVIVDLTSDRNGSEQQARVRVGPGGLAVEGTF